MEENPAPIDRATLRVLLVGHYFPPHVGGIENVIREQARHLAMAGLRVTVLTTAAGAPAGTTGSPEGYTVVRVPTSNLIERRTGVPFPIISPTAAVKFFRLVRAADVVHVHDMLYMTSWLSVLCAVLARKPIVLTQHVALIEHPSKLVKFVQRVVYGVAGRQIVRRARRITYLNSGVRDFLIGIGADSAKLRFVPNGVDSDLFRPPRTDERKQSRAKFGLPESEVLALFVGRFVPKKGFELLCAATSPNYGIVLVGGDAPDGVASTEGLLFLGSRDHRELAEIYRACDIFVLPSISEGFPLSVLEAMAAGLPVITSDDPGYRIYELDRENIRFVAPELPVVRAELERLAADAGKREVMAAYSRRVAVTKFSWQAHVEAVREIYGAAVEAS